jgi:hypothetical protein
MLRSSSVVACLLLLLLHAACTEDSSAPDAAVAESDAGSSDASFACTPRADCLDLDLQGVPFEACCSPVTDCGYTLPEPEPETLMYYPDLPELQAQLTEGDPEGRCVPSSFYFGVRPGLADDRVKVEGGDDILITLGCDSYTVLAFILPGCCLPDDTCALSTSESAPTLGYLAEDLAAPFASPECVPAETLNQQFRESGKLVGFAQTTASGSCDHAALDAMLPE